MKTSTPKTKGRAGAAKTPARAKAADAPAAARGRPHTKPASDNKGARRGTKSGSKAKSSTNAARAGPHTKPARMDGDSGSRSKKTIESVAGHTSQPQTIVRSVLQGVHHEAIRSLRSPASADTRRASAKPGKPQTRSFIIPEVGIKVTRIVKPATKPHKGFNPKTRESITVEGKPRRIVLKAIPMKRLLDAAGAVAR